MRNLPCLHQALVLSRVNRHFTRCLPVGGAPHRLSLLEVLLVLRAEPLEALSLLAPALGIETP